MSNFRKRATDAAFRRLRAQAGITEHYCRLADEARNGRPNRCGPDYYEFHAHQHAEQARKIAVEYSGFIARGSYL